MSGNAEEKRRIRGAMRELRRSIDPDAQAAHARQLKVAIQHQSWFRISRRLGCYWAADGEISLEPLIALSWKLGKRVYLPAVGEAGWMQFREYCPGTTLRRGRLGILEPPLQASVISADELDVVLVPLVAFSPDGGRLGMGGGYYDRLFSRGRQAPGQALRNDSQRPRLVGVAHNCQMLESLPVDDWDVPMQMIVTESGPIRPR